MRIWLDDLRPAPEGYIWCHSVREAIVKIVDSEQWLMSGLSNLIGFEIKVIDCDYDLGEFAADGGDGIELLNWLERSMRRYPIRLHTMNPVERDKMRAIIRKNGWTELL